MSQPTLLTVIVMREVNLKQFQRNMYDEIRNLPVLVVRKRSRHDEHPEPVFEVRAYVKEDKRSLIDLLVGDA